MRVSVKVKTGVKICLNLTNDDVCSSHYILKAANFNSKVSGLFHDAYLESVCIG